MRATNWLVTLVALGAPLVAAESAFAAPVAACGGIDFPEGVSCEVQTSGGCTAACTPVNVDTQCAVTLTGGCSGMCTAQAQASCTGSCNMQCQTDCMANASFDCDASCNTQCQGDCTSECSDSMNQSQCTSTCNANCSSNCNASCMGQASASCQGKCTGSCQGQCTASANIACELSCTPPSAYVNCETTVTGGCKTACSQPSGALFCNGQYVDTSKTSLDDCLQALLSQYNIKASGYAYSTCTNGTCTSNTGGNVSCAAATPGSGDFAFGGIAGLGMLGFGLAFARRRRARA